MKSRALCVVLASFFVVLGVPAAPPKAKPKEAPPKKEPEYSKVEVRGTIGRGSEPEPPSFLKSFSGYRVFLTIKVAGGEWRLDLDKAAEEVLLKNVGKQVTITGSFRGQAIRVKTVNGLDVD